MRSGTRAIITLAACVYSFAIASSLAPSTALAAPRGAPDDEARQRASSIFARGEALYRIGDYARAAALFDEAYRLAPHPDILWNAARSFERAGDYARAANDYAEYVSASAETSPDRKEAVAALDRLARKLGRLEIHAPAGATIVVDETNITTSAPYVVPGSHVIRVVLGPREEQRTVEVEAGSSRSVSFLAAAPASVEPIEPAQSPAPQPTPTAKAVESKKLSPLFFVAGATLSAAATAVAIGFGVDTLNARKRFDEAPSQLAFDEGESKELRTNVMIGVAAGLWALTAVTGIWLVEWKTRSTSVSLAMQPPFAGLTGAFE